ncbi:MAG: orotidine-5'-phosphate decarboxylase [Acidobacteria bacterium]|nr:orotidine-5'-phosphate decarboxylase [Acidobacteriota bacterium]
MSSARSRLIVALDLPDAESALKMVNQLSGHAGLFKVGLELFTREGPSLVQQIRDRGERVFLDLKLHDIPNTVRGAVRSACRLGADMLTVHASGGPAMIAAAAEEARDSGSPPLILAVTALTSLSADDIHALGVPLTPADWVERLAEIAQLSGAAGVVASAKELPVLRAKFGNGLKYVIPGIRPAGTATQDQSRIATPRDAIRAGADYIVVGRPVLQANDPAAAADAIVEEISAQG